MSYTVTLTLSEDDCLNVRLAFNMTACEWADKAMEHRQRGEPVDADTCERLRAKYHALWERVHDAQRLAEAEARAAITDHPTFNGTMEQICDRLRGGPRAIA